MTGCLAVGGEKVLDVNEPFVLAIVGFSGESMRSEMVIYLVEDEGGQTTSRFGSQLLST